MSEYSVSTTIGDYTYTLDPKFRFNNVFSPVTSFPQTYNISKSGYIAPFGSIIVDYATNSIHSRRLTINLFNGETSVEDSVIKVVYNGTDSITISKKSSPSGLGIKGYDVGGCAIGDESSYYVSLKAADNTLSSYPAPLSSVPYLNLNLPVISMSGCFSGCESLTTAPEIPSGVTIMLSCFEGCTSLTASPEIPSGVTNMDGCFLSCTSLTTAPEIPNSVTDVGFCFYNCSALTTAPVIPSSVKDMAYCFYNCASLTGDIYVMTGDLYSRQNCFENTTQPITLHGNNISTLQSLVATATNNNVYINTAPTTLPSTIECAPMNYQADNGLVQLSPQTDASLVSVQVPNGSGTMTTTLEDALVDLYGRTSGLKTTLTSPQTINGITITPLSDGSINLNGTATDSVELKFFLSNEFKAGRYTVNDFGWKTLYMKFYYKAGVTLDGIILRASRTITILKGSNPAFLFNIPPSYLPPITFYVIIPSGQTYNNEIIKPIIRLVGDA